jgi:hypothetical protein
VAEPATRTVPTAARKRPSPVIESAPVMAAKRRLGLVTIWIPTISAPSWRP